eukprot:PITA_15861
MFHINANASQTVVEEVLGQQEEKKLYAVYYVSKNLTFVELNYMVMEKEFLVVIYVVNKFRHYITGYPTFVHTDHAAIKYLMKKPVTLGHITRWLLLVQEFDITIIDKLGKDNIVVDFLSILNAENEGEPVEDSFLDENLFANSTNTPWYADIASYLATGKICHCVAESDIYEVLRAAHDGPCGGHFVDKRIGQKVLQMGYFWRSIFSDSWNYVRRCNRFQWMGQHGHLDEMPLQPQVVLESFEIWAIDFVGPFNPPSYQKVHILVCTDYVTMWVETKALEKATEQVVSDFLFEEIFARYGTR